MKNICSFSTMVLSAFFCLSCIDAKAQDVSNVGDPEMDKLFSDRKEHESYLPNYSNTGSSYYWIQDDTLWTCGLLGGDRIALSDINFEKAKIEKSEFVVKGTKSDFVYRLIIKPKQGKPTLNYGCFMAMPYLANKADLKYDQTIKLDLESKELAERAVSYLKNRSTPQSNATNANSDFDSNLYDLIMGLKDDFESLRGTKHNEKNYASKVQLAGARSTNIYIGLMFNTWVLADFGEYATAADARVAFDKVVKQIDDCKKNVVSLVKMNEMNSDVLTVQSYIPFDGLDQLPASMKKFSIDVQIIQNMKFDKDLNKTVFYVVNLRIEKRS